MGFIQIVIFLRSNLFVNYGSPFSLEHEWSSSPRLRPLVMLAVPWSLVFFLWDALNLVCGSVVSFLLQVVIV